MEQNYCRSGNQFMQINSLPGVYILVELPACVMVVDKTGKGNCFDKPFLFQ